MEPIGAEAIGLQRVSGFEGGLQMIRRRTPGAFAALLIALILSGCSSTGPAPVYEGFGPAPAGFYRIRRGDTLYKIARRHKVGYKTLAHWNKLGPPYRIKSGSLLRVEPPQGNGTSKVRSYVETAKTTRGAKKRSRTGSKARVKTSIGASKRTAVSNLDRRSGLRWRWPLEGRVVQGFRGGDRTRQGIRIAGRPGQKVLAAESGTVVYSGSGLRGYGNLIILKHNNSYLSAYGFNRRLLVSEGAGVKRGQSIAEVGQASGGEYLLHFEIRRSGTAVDPLRYLP
jgi:lipoprotein NlpD